jgi:ethanolamine utilization protein EutQ
VSTGPARRTFTSEDVRRVAESGASTLVVGAHDRLTPLARDLARDRGVTVVVQEATADRSEPPGQSTGWLSGPPRRPSAPRLVHVAGVATLPLQPFPADIGRPAMDVRLRDVVTGADGMPMAAGVLSLREGSFPWHLDYDEIEYVLEGELHITCNGQLVVGRPGDVIAVPKGSSITFGTPSWAKFLYVTYPADWNG